MWWLRNVVVIGAALATLAGCALASAHDEKNVFRIGYVPSSSVPAARQERYALVLAFSEANEHKTLGRLRIALQDGASERDIAVIAGARSDDESWLNSLIAFVSVPPERSSGSLRPMRSLNGVMGADKRPCAAESIDRKKLFEARFRALARETPRPEAYVAYAEAESIIIASQRLLAEDRKSVV